MEFKEPQVLQEPQEPQVHKGLKEVILAQHELQEPKELQVLKEHKEVIQAPLELQGLKVEQVQ